MVMGQTLSDDRENGVVEDNAGALVLDDAMDINNGVDAAEIGPLAGASDSSDSM